MGYIKSDQKKKVDTLLIPENYRKLTNFSF